MRRQRKILLLIFTSLTVFFSYSIDAETKIIQLNSIDNLHIECNYAECTYSCVDHVDQDQISPAPETVFTENPVYQISIPRNKSVIFDFGPSVWQPPRFF